MLTELRNRGLADALIVCCDGLKGLPGSIRITWPDAILQTCVVHMVRNSLRYSSTKHWSRITAAMREINMTGKTNGWKTILNTLTVHYESDGPRAEL